MLLHSWHILVVSRPSIIEGSFPKRKQFSENAELVITLHSSPGRASTGREGRPSAGSTARGTPVQYTNTGDSAATKFVYCTGVPFAVALALRRPSEIWSLTHRQRHIIHVHIGVIRPATRIFGIQELDADGLSGIGRETERHLHPCLIVCGIHEQLLQDIAAAVDNISLLPAVGTRVVAGGPVVEAERSRSGAAGNRDHLVSHRVARLSTASAQL